MCLSNHYLNTNPQNLNASRLFQIRDLKQIKKAFHLKSFSASTSFPYTMNPLHNSALKKPQVLSPDWRYIQKPNEKKFLLAPLRVDSCVLIGHGGERRNFHYLENFSTTGKSLNFSYSYRLLFVNRLWLFYVLLDGTFQTFHETLLFQTFLNSLNLDETKKPNSMDPSKEALVSFKKLFSVLRKSFSKPQLSNFCEKKILFFKDQTSIKEDRLSLLFLESYEYFFKTSSNLTFKEFLTRHSTRLHRLFFKAYQFSLSTHVTKLDTPRQAKLIKQSSQRSLSGTMALKEAFESKSSGLNPTIENLEATFFQNSMKNSEYTKVHFFILKEIFYLYTYHLCQGLYARDSNVKLSSSIGNSFKLRGNSDLKSFASSILYQKKNTKVPALRGFELRSRSLTTVTYLDHSRNQSSVQYFSDLELCSIHTNKSALLPLDFTATMKQYSLKKGLLQFSLSKNFHLNQTNSSLNQLFPNTVGFAWLYFNLGLTFDSKQMNSNSDLSSGKIQKLTFRNNYYIRQSSRFLKTLMLYSFGSNQYKICLKKRLKSKSLSFIPLLLQFENKLEKKSLLNFWVYFYGTPDPLLILFSELYLQNTKDRVEAWNQWFFNSLAFLNYSNRTLLLKDSPSRFLQLNLASKNRVKQQVLSELCTERVFGHSLLHNFKNLIKNSGSLSQSDLILKLTQLLYTYSYYLFTEWDFKNIRMLEKEMFNYLWKWACRRHNNKNKKWIRSKYFFRLTSNRWVFASSEETLTSNHKVLVASKDGIHFFYLPLLSQIVFHLTKGLSKKFK